MKWSITPDTYLTSLGMEKGAENDTTSATSTTTATSRSVVMTPYNDEENQMVFWILKELDLFLEKEEASLKKEASALDADELSLRDKEHSVVMVTQQKVVDNDGNHERNNNNNSKGDVAVVTEKEEFFISHGVEEERDAEEETNEEAVTTAVEVQYLVKVEERTDSVDENRHDGTTISEEGESVVEEDQKEANCGGEEEKDGNKEEDEEDSSDDDNDDSQSYTCSSFGMPIADACAECFHAEINSALTNAVHNSHVVCLQAILEQLSQTREAAEKKEKKKKKRGNTRTSRNNGSSDGRTKVENGHVVACTVNQCDTGGEKGDDSDVVSSSEPNLVSSTLLLEAVEIGHAQVVHLILKCLEDLQQLHDALLVCEKVHGHKPIHVAAYENHTGCLDLLLNKTPVKRQFWRDRRGRSPLLSAAAGGAVQCLKRLITVDDLGAMADGGVTAGKRLKRSG